MRKTRSDILIIAGIGALFFLPFLGRVHLFDWDEINFAEISREMIILKDYLRLYVNFEPFWQKPPFFFWLQVVSMKLFGINEYAARFPNAICGLITLPVLYHMGKSLYSRRFGWLWAGAYFGSILPHLYFKSGIIDPWFNFFIFLGLYFLIVFYWKKEGKAPENFNLSPYTYLLIAGFTLGMGILTKGPVAYLIVCLVLGVYWIRERFRFFINVPDFLLFSVVCTLVSLAWFGIETWKNGPSFSIAFIRYNWELASTHSAGHKGFPGYHFVVLLVGCFPGSIYALRSFWKVKQDHAYQEDFRIWMLMLFWVVLILFTIVQSKIVHYSSMCYFPLTYLAALSLEQYLSGKESFPKWKMGMMWGIGGLFVIAPFLLTYVGFNPAFLQQLLTKDPFAVANLEAEINWTGWEVMAGVWMLLMLVVFAWYKRQQKIKEAIILSFGGTAVYIFLTLAFFIVKIESVSQAAAIRFFEEQAGKESYIIASGYRSYAPLFYSKKQPPANFDPERVIEAFDPSFKSARESNEDWLFRGEVDKPVFVVTKIPRQERLEKERTLVRIKEENGFLLYERKYSGPCHEIEVSACDSLDCLRSYVQGYELTDIANCYTEESISDEKAFEGEFSLKVKKDFPYSEVIYVPANRDSSSFKVSAQVLASEETDLNWVFAIHAQNGDEVYWENIPTNIADSSNTWQEVSGAWQIPDTLEIPQRSKISMYLWMNEGDSAYVDKFSILQKAP